MFKKYLKAAAKIVSGTAAYITGLVGLNVCTSMVGAVGCFFLSIGGLVYSATGWIDGAIMYSINAEEQYRASLT